jgi:hypothetical protein
VHRDLLKVLAEGCAGTTNRLRSRRPTRTGVVCIMAHMMSSESHTKRVAPIYRCRVRGLWPGPLRRSGLMLTSTEGSEDNPVGQNGKYIAQGKLLQPSFPELADQRAETQAGLPRRVQSSHLRQCRTLRRCLRAVLPDDDQESRICITILIEANRVASVRVTVRTIAEEDQP